MFKGNAYLADRGTYCKWRSGWGVRIIDLSLTRLKLQCQRRIPLARERHSYTAKALATGSSFTSYWAVNSHVTLRCTCTTPMPRQKVEVQPAAEKEHGHVAFSSSCGVVRCLNPSFLQ